MSTTMKVGVIGVGSLGELHTRILSELEQADLVGVYDVDTDRAREVAERHGTTAYESIEDLAARVEAATIVVPTDHHYEVFNRLAAHDLHLLVEKPIASTTAEAEEMVATAKERGLILQVGHVERFNPVMDFLESNLDHPRFIEVIRLGSYPPPRAAAAPRGTEVSVVLDLMIHDLEIILHLVASEVSDVRAIGVPVLSSSEDIANARIAFENGCIANVTSSRISQERMRKIRVFQEDTYVSLDYMDQSGHLYKKENGQITREDVPIVRREPLVHELSSFLDCVANLRDPVVGGHHASRALQLAVEICRVIREQPT